MRESDLCAMVRRMQHRSASRGTSPEYTPEWQLFEEWKKDAKARWSATQQTDAPDVPSLHRVDLDLSLHVHAAHALLRHHAGAIRDYLSDNLLPLVACSHESKLSVTGQVLASKALFGRRVGCGAVAVCANV